MTESSYWEWGTVDTRLPLSAAAWWGDETQAKHVYDNQDPDTDIALVRRLVTRGPTEVARRGSRPSSAP